MCTEMRVYYDQSYILSKSLATFVLHDPMFRTVQLSRQLYRASAK